MKLTRARWNSVRLLLRRTSREEMYAKDSILATRGSHLAVEKSHFRSSCAVSEHAESATTSLPTPLRERAAVHRASGEDVLKLMGCLEEESRSLNDKLFELDGGPTTSELLREVDWLMEDSVAGVRDSEVNGWSELCWRQIKDYLKESNFETQVLLRESLEGIRHLWMRRIACREPFQYITATSYWMDYVLVVGPGVLIPRPETEVLAEIAQNYIMESNVFPPGPWVDLGCGSGALAISIAHALEKVSSPARVWAVDKSPSALCYAAANAARCDVAHKIDMAQGSWFEPIANLKGQLSGIVSNPPYIPHRDLDGLQAEVGKYEPHMALDGGNEDGMRELRDICSGAREFLAAGGFLGLETNGEQQASVLAEELRSMLLEDGKFAFEGISTVRDLSGIDRFVIAHRRG